jgi:hypothetical protein
VPSEWSGSPEFNELQEGRVRVTRAANQVEDTIVSFAAGLKIGAAIITIGVIGFTIWILVVSVW